ncbi:hypothetical protein [Massilia pseudoviolaceinigra]|uniref:hypothetical protein n=1 Tax=Massilia pseudoviolaceinigra TaxID=3057165 RepID=UPI002796C38E|nr:hypothetical protein [Massilia sp. CCM 9206]MDQ1925118.1 hypothetical protein [Massilia sp. CCM 9206]
MDLGISAILALRKPFLWAGRKILAFAGAYTVQPIYQHSHEHYLAVRRWQRRWTEMAPDIEYLLACQSTFSKEDHPEQYILIRNVGTTVVEKINLCVEAKCGILLYQDALTAYGIQPGQPVRLLLPNQPFEELIFQEDSISASYDSRQVFPLNIVRNNKIEIYRGGAHARHPGFNDSTGHWKRWRGRLYNMNAIVEARRDLMLHIASSLCWKYGLVSMEPTTLASQAMRSRQYLRLLGVVAFAIAKCNPVLNTILWAKLLLRRERLVFELDGDMVAATKYVMDKGKSSRPVRVVDLNTQADEP